jgi:hypothetical protein
MATNNILGFCTGANPNVLTPTAWQTTPARSSGFVSGIALSSHVNTAVVGGANIAHAVGEFIKNQLNEDVNPTDEAELVSQFLRALQIFIQRGGACPVGSIIPYLGGDVPYGWLLANGASVLRSQYNKLFALIGTKFGAVDEAHFNLPNLHHRFIEGTTSLSEVGSYVEAGLPNIYGGGVEYTDVKAYATPNGAFFSTDWSSETEFSVGDGKFVKERTLGFNANKSNATYSDSVSTVQVSAIFGLNLIKAF